MKVERNVNSYIMRVQKCDALDLKVLGLNAEDTRTIECASLPRKLVIIGKSQSALESIYSSIRVGLLSRGNFHFLISPLCSSRGLDYIYIFLLCVFTRRVVIFVRYYTWRCLFFWIHTFFGHVENAYVTMNSCLLNKQGTKINVE